MPRSLWRPPWKAALPRFCPARPGVALVRDYAIRVKLSPVLSAQTSPVRFRILESLQNVRWVITVPFLRLESKPPGVSLSEGVSSIERQIACQLSEDVNSEPESGAENQSRPVREGR